MNTSGNERDVADAPFDYDDLLGRCVGRRDLLEKVLINFTDLLPPQLDQLEQTLKSADLAKFRNLAHRLKGGALTISARRLGKLAEQLEASANEANPPTPEAGLPTLAAGLAELRQESVRLTTNVRARLKKD